MSNIVMQVDQLGRQFRVGTLQQGSSECKSVHEELVKADRAPIWRAGRLLHGEPYGAAELDETMWALKDICFRPHFAKGRRGFRIVDASVSRRDLLMNCKPNSCYVSLDEIVTVFQDEPDFPDILVIEYLPGQELITDCLCLDGTMLLTMDKTVEQARWGMIVRGELVRSPDLAKQRHEILRVSALSYCVNLQFIDGKVIEINLRVSTFIHGDGLIAPYLAVKLAPGQLDKEGVRACQERLGYGRRMVCYLDQVDYDGGVE